MAKRAEYLKIDDKIHARETRTEEGLFVLRRQGKREIEQTGGPRVQTAAASVRLSSRECKTAPEMTL